MRASDPEKMPFKKLLKDHGSVLELIAKSRIEVDAARLIVLNAAMKIDVGDAKGAMKEIAEAKILVPKTAIKIIDRAIQLFGGAGVSQDTPLANMWAQARVLRIVDGPDEVHMMQLGRSEVKRGAGYGEKIAKQKRATGDLMKYYNVSSKGMLKPRI